jgi:nitrate reductase NapAB chaperone NapD
MNRTEAIAFVTAQLNANLEVYKQDQQTKRSDKSNAAMAAGRPYDIQGELAKAILAGDKPRVAKLKEALITVGEARKPGLDMELVKKFENLPGVKNMQIMLNGLRMQTDPNPKTLERIRQLEGQLAATATQNGIDPAKVGVSGSASSSGPDLSQWGDVTKN